MDQYVSIRIPRRWLRSAVVLVLIGAVLAPVAVVASHQFTDVPDSSIFHNDIAWLADNGVTQGCNPPANDMFCPADNVTREQMAAFMNRLATSQIVDAGSLNGQTADDLTSRAYFLDARGGPIPDTGVLETVAQLTGLPAGSYVIIAKTFMTYLGGDGQGPTTCELVAESDVDLLRATVDNLHHLPATLTLAHTFAADNGTVELRCAHTGGGDENVAETKITAISVDSLITSSS